MAVELDMEVHGEAYHKERAPTGADALRMALPLLHELAAAGAEREEADRAPAHAPCCHHCAAGNTTACVTSAGNNASASCRSAMDCALDRMGCSFGR